ncbi:MAG: hypothetical protein J0L82_11940 [Deltaproteobacteria bacterium]|jgi:DNA-binding TFAR19-related protein (PDSD5 family)|nr:hypothetical protein [Deltaproteobacteria bacterium]
MKEVGTAIQALKNDALGIEALRRVKSFQLQTSTWICENKKVSSYIFERVTDALAAVCADDMGKTAARERLKEIQMFRAAGQIQAVIEKGLQAFFESERASKFFDALTIE